MLKTVVASVVLALVAPLSIAQDASSITIGERLSMHSEILDEDRPYWVYLPDSYERSGDRQYPVMYLLDGEGHFQSATGAVQHMSSGYNGNWQIPEMIVVAIPNTNRPRDLTPTKAEVGYDGQPATYLQGTGGGDAFLRFINDELFPNIESSYRTAPHRIFVGHSLGGLMVLYALLDAPDMFQAYISIDPSMWWDEQALTPRAEKIFSKPAARTGRVYISQARPGDAPGSDVGLMRRASSRFADILATAESQQFRTQIEYFDEEDHGSVPLISLYRGLLHVFDDYKLAISTVIDDPLAISGHFDRVSRRLGIPVHPPEAMLNRLGYFLLRQNDDTEGAITVFELNVANYPQSVNVYDSLAEALMAAGDVNRAIANYEKTLAMEPDNENAIDQLETLKKMAEQQ